MKNEENERKKLPTSRQWRITPPGLDGINPLEHHLSRQSLQPHPRRRPWRAWHDTWQLLRRHLLRG